MSHPHTWNIHKSQACAGTSGARSRHLQAGAKPGGTDSREQVQPGNMKQSRCLTEAPIKHQRVRSSSEFAANTFRANQSDSAIICSNGFQTWRLLFRCSGGCDLLPASYGETGCWVESMPQPSIRTPCCLRFTELVRKFESLARSKSSSGWRMECRSFPKALETMQGWIYNKQDL